MSIKEIINSRRDFLKKLAVFAGSSTVLSGMPWWSPLSAQPPGDSPSDRVRIGIIGVGSRGRRLTLFLLQNPGLEIAAVCDDYEPHYQRAIEITDGKAKAFYDYRKLLEMKDLDAVVIATPLFEHARICIDSFQAGKHVFCEKSLAYNFEEYEAIAQAYRASGKIFQIGFQRLYAMPFLKAFEYVKSGTIGDITQIRAYWHRNRDWRREIPTPDLERKINWRLYREYSCGLMTELASHHLQVANWFLDAHPISCVGYGSVNYWKDGRELHDNVNLVYKYPDGVQMVYDSMISNRRYGLEIQIMGPKGTIEGETGKIYAEYPPEAPGIVQLINQLERDIFEAIPIGGPSWAPDLKKDTKGTYLADNDWSGDGTDIQLVAFANAVRAGKPIPGMMKHACYGGIAAVMGQFTMEQNREIKWPEGLEI